MARPCYKNDYNLESHQIISFKKFYGDTSTEDMCTIFSLNSDQVKKLAKKLGLKKPRNNSLPGPSNYYFLSEKEIEDFKAKFPHKKTSELSVIFRLSENQIYRLKYKLGLTKHRFTEDVNPKEDLEVKKCGGPCQAMLPLKDFNKQRKSKDGRQSYCRKCQKNQTEGLRPGSAKTTEDQSTNKNTTAPEWWRLGNERILKQQQLN